MSGLIQADAYVSTPVVLAISNIDSPTVYIDIANCGDIAGSSSRAVVDVSAHGALARRKVTTLLDEGDFTLPLYFKPTQSPADGSEITHTDPTNGLYWIYKRNDLRAYALFYRDEEGTAKFFNAFISKWAEKDSVAGVTQVDVTFTVDGEVLTGTESGGVATAVFAQAQA